MKITKFEHACLLVEMPAPLNRTALFDPGTMSESSIDVDSLEYLDDIIITHGHPDHVSPELMRALTKKFPAAHITAPTEVVKMLEEQGITGTSDQPSKGIVFFDSPHENVQPLFPQPEQHGIHYLGRLSHPGDSHSFTETMPILALPLAGPWAAAVTALNLAIKLQPSYVLPVHDWHLRPEARDQLYTSFTKQLKEHNITFVPLVTGEPVVLEVSEKS